MTLARCLHQNGAALLRDDTVQFGYDSDRLSAGDAALLDAHAAYLTSPAGLAENLVVEGHTDERGTRTYNMALGERRAQAVKSYLILKGLLHPVSKWLAMVLKSL